MRLSCKKQGERSAGSVDLELPGVLQELTWPELSAALQTLKEEIADKMRSRRRNTRSPISRSRLKGKALALCLKFQK